MEELVIEQTEPRYKNKLVLRGAAGPISGLGFATRQRNRVRWHAGAGEGSAHVYGAQPMPTTIQLSLRLEDTLKAEIATLNGENLERPVNVVGALEQIVIDGAIVVLTWGSRERLGILTEVDPVEVAGIPGGFDVSFEFMPVGKAEPLPLEVPLSIPNFWSQLKDLWDTALEALAFPAKFVQGLANQLEAKMNEINDQIRRAQSVANAYNSAITDVKGASNAFLGIGDTITGLARDLRALVQIPAGEAAKSDSPEALVGAWKTDRTFAQIASELEQFFAQRREQLKQNTTPQIRGIRTGVAGQDLRRLAFAQYGDVALWTRLARYNGLRSPKLKGGERIVFPEFGANEYDNA